MFFKRRKSFLFFGVVLCLIVYYAWISNQNTFSISNEQSINILRYNFNNNNQEKIIRHKEIVVDEKSRVKIDESHFKSILKFLHSSKAFLVNTDLLNKIWFIQTQAQSSNDEEKDYKLNLLDSFQATNEVGESEIILNFGLHLSSLTLFNEELLSTDTFKACAKYEMKGTFIEDSIITNIYLKCNNILVQVSVFYDRGTFLWIGSDTFKLDQKYFGDIDRAVHKLNTTAIKVEFKSKINVPANIKRFLFDYEHSKFLECNRELARKNMQLMGANYTQNAKRNKMISTVMVHISETLESFYKHYFLAGGTLLGWYRDCGIIPHTQDVDIAIWAHEYEKKIKKHFLGNKIVRVWGTLGLINDSYEFRLYNDQFTFDLFLVYKYNLTHQWCGYQVNRVKFRRWLPNFDELCSVELLDHKYLVPCDPIQYLNKEYGTRNWDMPKAKNYSWTNVVYMKNWTDTEWPMTIKYYDKNGDPIKAKMLNYINSHFDAKHQINELPPDD